MTDLSTVPTWPTIQALTRPDGTGELTINGTSHPIEAATVDEARSEIIRRVTDTASKLGRAVHVATDGPEGQFPIVVHPDGRIEPNTTQPAALTRNRPTPPPAPTVQPAAAPSSPPSAAGGTADHVHPSAPPAEVAPAPSEFRYSTDQLLQQLRPTARPRARTGWRSWFGLAPSKKEQALEQDLTDVRTAFPCAITVMVANPKGGGGKTPTSLVIAGEMGHARGGGVVVWDNNELRGNARDRSYFPHTRGVADLLDAADRLEQPDASFTELTYFLAHQTHGKYYVLSSDQAGRVVMDQEQVRRVHRILSRFFEIIIIDTGNNEQAPNWLAARDLADSLIVPMKWRQDSILVANRMLATMAEHATPLLRRTLLIGTNGPGDSQDDARRAVIDRFSPNHPIAEIRTDPHLHAGAIIDRRQLQARTQRAGLHAAAIVARLCNTTSPTP